ncbi:hypothetical protein RND81_06G250000 [Saponaria officinalis]|uniref:Secreted protein n=1 Tax=Saponaria officinalis TaxID=3572 RepID=A0AAW1KDZ9_SAPOF
MHRAHYMLITHLVKVTIIFIMVTITSSPMLFCARVTIIPQLPAPLISAIQTKPKYGVQNIDSFPLTILASRMKTILFKMLLVSCNQEKRALKMAAKIINGLSSHSCGVNELTTCQLLNQ